MRQAFGAFYKKVPAADMYVSVISLSMLCFESSKDQLNNQAGFLNRLPVFCFANYLSLIVLRLLIIRTCFAKQSALDVFRRPGGYCEVAAPDPIPNSAVKRFSADGTLS